MPRRRATRRSRHRTPSGGAGAACVVAAVALAGAMGVVVMRKDSPRTRTRHQAPAPVTEMVHTVRTAPAIQTPERVSFVAKTRAQLREVEAALPRLKRTRRGPDFEKRQVDLLGKVTDARDEIGAYLDMHADDDRAQALWDRVMRLYIALQKL